MCISFSNSGFMACRCLFLHNRGKLAKGNKNIEKPTSLPVPSSHLYTLPVPFANLFLLSHFYFFLFSSISRIIILKSMVHLFFLIFLHHHLPQTQPHHPHHSNPHHSHASFPPPIHPHGTEPSGMQDPASSQEP